MLNFLADWLSGNQRQTLADSLTAFVGQHTSYTSTISPPTYTDSSSYSASATANNSSETSHHDQQRRSSNSAALDRITRITPTMRASTFGRPDD